MSLLSRSASVVLSWRGLFCFLVIILLSLPLAGAESLEAEVYMAGLNESTWQFSGSSALCELSHEIPQFGHARFYRLAGKELGFSIKSYQPVPERVEAVLREASPEWAHAPPDRLERMVVVESGRKPITLDRRPAGWLLSSLAKGQIGSFELLDWNDSRKQMQIRLSPVNFQRPYRAFKQCLAQLSGKGFEFLRQTTVHFASAAHTLDERSREMLRRLADYIQADSDVAAVRIAGHADDQGKNRDNLRLSARRAKSVRDELVSLGVKSTLLNSRYYGESRPRARGRAEGARAVNRRVEIELVH